MGIHIRSHVSAFRVNGNDLLGVERNGNVIFFETNSLHLCHLLLHNGSCYSLLVLLGKSVDGSYLCSYETAGVTMYRKSLIGKNRTAYVRNTTSQYL